MSEKNEIMIGNEAFDLENIPNHLSKVNEAIKAIKGVDDEESSANGKYLPGFGELKDINDTASLIAAYSSVSGKEKAYEKAAKEMNLTKIPPFKIEGISAEKWKEAIIRREIIASSAAKLEALNKVKTILTNRLSDEDKAKAELEELKDVLKDIM